MLSRDVTMWEALRQAAEPRRLQEALVCDGARLTYGQLLERVDTLARGLHGLDVDKGARVATLLQPGHEFACTFFAIARLGAAIVPLNPQLRPRALGAVLGDADPVALVTARPIDDQVRQRAAGLRHLIAVGVEEIPGPALSEVIAAGQGSPLPAVEVAPHDLLALLYTSGTTGSPKATMHTHRSLIAPVAASIKLRELWTRHPTLKTVRHMAVALARYRERLLRAWGRPQAFLSTVGWHTITGLEVMLQGLLMGDRLIAMSRFHPREAMRLIEAERVTVLVAVPMAFQVMLALSDFDQYDTSTLLICGTGAAPCSPQLAQQIQERFGCALHIGFGATETGGGIAATSLADSDRRQAETVGRPMPGMEIKIVDPERRELPPGEVGELACRSDSVMLGYYGAPDATAEVIDEEGWYYTGDLACIDQQGYLHIAGRKRDVIIRGGQNVYPAEVESYLTAHPKIREAAVVGVPAAVGGEQVWAFVLLEDGVKMSEQEVLDHCRAELEAFKIPGSVQFVQDFPRSGTGKVQKFRLREEALRRHPSRG
jgi:fatty-acyl-CoA synthase